MKDLKKFLAIFLSLAIFASINILPTSADQVITDTVKVEKYISLFDLTTIAVNMSCTSGLPEGMEKIGVSAFNPNWAHKHGFDGNQSIVRNEDESKSWRLDFTTAMNKGGWLNDFGNEFSVQFAIPEEYVNSITSISADITYASDKKLGYKFGVANSTNASAFNANNSSDAYDGKYSSTDTINGSSLKITKKIDSLYKIDLSKTFRSNSGLTEKWQRGDTASCVYLTLVSRNCDGTEGGFALINDIGINVLVDKEIVVGTAPEERTFNLLDFDDYDDGSFSLYPTGVSEFKANNVPQFSGEKSVITNTDGKKALKLDLSSTEFSYNTEETDKILQGGYNQVYSIKLEIPTNHIPFINKINFKYEKQSKDALLYNFGVSDGTNFSKEGAMGNKVISAETNGVGNVILDPATLNFATTWQAGANGASEELWGNNEFSQLFLWVTDKSEASGNTGDGYFIIDELSYTVYATDDELKAAKGYISGFENKSGTVTKNATGGTRAFEYATESGKTTHTLSLSTNPNLSEAKGISFWVTNPTSKDTTFKICLKGKGTTSYVVNDSYPVAANSTEKINIDFSSIYRDKNYSNASGFTQGTAVSLTAVQIAALRTITFMCREKNLTVYVDDFYLNFVESRGSSAIPFENVVGDAQITTDGKLKFPSSETGSDITVKIPITDHALREGEKLTVNFDSDVAAKYYVKMIGTNDDGKAAHWKWGYERKSGDALKAGNSGYTFTFNFAGVNAKYNRGNIHEGTDESCWSCWPNVSDGVTSGHANNPPSGAEKASVHTLEIRVFENIGTTDQAVTLNSITFTNTPNKITAASTDNGTVSIGRSTAFSGEVVNFSVTPNEGYYLKQLDLVCDNKTTAIPLENGEGDNFGNYYSFIMPMSNVVITPVFEKINETVYYEVNYPNNKDVEIDFSIPLKGQKAYSTTANAYKDLKNYKAMFVVGEALEKYGFKTEDLTYEKVMELIEKGHHLAKYIYIIDETCGKKTVDGNELIHIDVKINDVSVKSRRADLALMVYADFEEDSIEDYYSIESKSIDKYFYGDNLCEEFGMTYGINYDSAMQNLTTLKYSNRIFSLDTWLDIKAHGFDHVRLPVDFGEITYADGRLMEEHLLKLDKCLDTILRAGMTVVMDLHGYKSINTDFSTTRPEFLGVWDQLAVRYAHLPLSVAFQLINEPRFQDKTGPDVITRAEIMSVQEEAIDIIRSVKGNEIRKIAISTQINMTSEMGNISDKILATDNLILDIHYYSPMSFSHSGNDEWDGIIGNGGYASGATEFSDESNKNAMIKLANFEKAHPNFITWIGEWGAFKPNYEKKLEYYKSITGYAKEYGIAWAIWDYASAWGPYTEGSGWKADILESMGLGEYITE